MFHVVETSVYELINWNKVCTALGRMGLGRNNLTRGGTTDRHLIIIGGER